MDGSSHDNLLDCPSKAYRNLQCSTNSCCYDGSCFWKRVNNHKLEAAASEDCSCGMINWRSSLSSTTSCLPASRLVCTQTSHLEDHFLPIPRPCLAAHAHTPSIRCRITSRLIVNMSSTGTYLSNLLKTDLTEFAETSNLSEYVPKCLYRRRNASGSATSLEKRELTFVRL